MNSAIIKNISPVRTRKGLFLLPCLLLLAVFSQSVFSQSSDVNFPTPIITNEISGTIPARAVGDSRLTRFYYRFDGNQGDIFINVKTNNLNGDIDIFTVKELDSLTKITIYSDSSENETGRVIYLRKPEKLILRIEARSPNDDPATFTVKFAGSFAPLPLTLENMRVSKPKVKSENQGVVKVNAIGTIIEAPKPEPSAENKTPVKSEETAEKTEDQAEKATSVSAEIPEIFDPTKKTETILKDFELENKTETAASADTEKAQPKITSDSGEIEVASKTENSVVENQSETDAAADSTETAASEKREVKANSVEKIKTEKADETSDTNVVEKTFDPSQLANVRLKISLKNGEKIEYPMSEVVWFNVNQGVLTVITNGGKIEKFSILDVAKMTIE